MEDKIMEATENHLLNIQFLKDNTKPSKKQLEKMYGYLDYCFNCGKKFRFAEPSQHGFEGNSHKFGCSVIARSFGYLYRLIKLITFPIWLPILLGLFFIGWIWKRIK